MNDRTAFRMKIRNGFCLVKRKKKWKKFIGKCVNKSSARMKKNKCFAIELFSVCVARTPNGNRRIGSQRKRKVTRFGCPTESKSNCAPSNKKCLSKQSLFRAYVNSTEEPCTYLIFGLTCFFFFFYLFSRALAPFRRPHTFSVLISFGSFYSRVPLASSLNISFAFDA